MQFCITFNCNATNVSWPWPNKAVGSGKAGKALALPDFGQMETVEMETGNGKWKWKTETVKTWCK